MNDKQLIFLISLPRSGSTLLQKMLGSHKEIHTTSEPWLMLHPLSIFRDDAIIADYNHLIASQGVQGFLKKGLGNDEWKERYFEILREVYLKLYEKHLDPIRKQLFLDKTPRYYLIFDELISTFPNAKFVILYRNPFAVLASMIQTWVRSDINRLSKYRVDLEDGIDFLARDFSGYSNVCEVRYEKLLEDPFKQLSRLQNFLDIAIDLDGVNYDVGEHWDYGDQETIYSKDSPDSAHADKWVNELHDPQVFNLLKSYFVRLGPKKIEDLGYSSDDIFRKLADAETVYGHDPVDMLDFATFINEEVVDEFSELSLSALHSKLVSILERFDQTKRELDKFKKISEISEIKIVEKNKMISEAEALSCYKITELEKALDIAQEKIRDKDKKLSENIAVESYRINQLETLLSQAQEKIKLKDRHLSAEKARYLAALSKYTDQEMLKK